MIYAKLTEVGAPMFRGKWERMEGVHDECDWSFRQYFVSVLQMISRRQCYQDDNSILIRAMLERKIMLALIIGRSARLSFYQCSGVTFLGNAEFLARLR